MTMRRGWPVLVLLGSLLPGGCASLGYYARSVSGEVHLLSSGRDISSVIGDPTTAPELRARLRLALDARRFAVDSLHLPDNGSYTEYVALDREYVTWAVVATPPFSLQPRTWCFPFAGCVAYRGYFDKAAAERFATGLRRSGDDVHVGGVPAYSTLGWFDDPLLSSMLATDDAQVAATLFHELAHQRLYVPGDTDFNEGFASVVAETGLERYLRARGRMAAWRQWQQLQAREREVMALVARTRERLRTLYASDRADAEKLAGKQAAFRQLRAAYRKLKTSWDGSTAFDGWFEGPFNNARLALMNAYQRYRPAFRALLAEDHGDLQAFYRDAAKIGRRTAPQRAALMDVLMRQAARG
ncbi:MAG: aminopeptidase, partial [Gammaproteobacteria bacterium]